MFKIILVDLEGKEETEEILAESFVLNAKSKEECKLRASATGGFLLKTRSVILDTLEEIALKELKEKAGIVS